MSYEPFKSVGTRKFTNLSGSGTLQAAGNVFLGGSLNVTGAVTLAGPASGSAAGSGSYLGLSSTGVPVLTNPEVLRRKPINCQFTSSAADNITLTPVGIDSRAIVPILSGTTLLNVEVRSDLTMDFTAANGAGGLDTGTVDTSDQGYYVYLITKAGGADAALMASLSNNNPTMPATYTYKSQALFFAFYNSTIEPFVNRADGWTYCRDQGLTAGTDVDPFFADLSAFLPVSGTAGVNIIARNTATSSRTLYIYLRQIYINQAGNRGGHAFIVVNDLGKRTNGDGIYLQPMYIEFPVPTGDETIGYDWNGSVTSGMNIVQLGWKTEAYS
jgi:hypothetical protein